MAAEAPKTTVTQRAVDQVRALIADGALQPGERLPTERELAVQFGLSRSSMREAIRALTAMGVLEARHGAGIYVTSLQPSDLLETFGIVAEISRGDGLAELLQVRRILEPAATALAAARATEKHLKRMAEQLEIMSAGSTVEEIVAADLAFHRIIAEAAGNAMLAAIIDGLSTRTFRARIWRGHKDAGVLADVRQEHERIHRAVAGRDPQAAAAAAAVHVDEVEQWLVAHAGEADWRSGKS
ncbi:FadR/GntR family transcriptional regulator [Embleya scabrispora]|uniref:FadR/GntR family transcriptional regulator n=1 Tax=Embleya scabrispora TaxID=159449 RepID=UPI00039CFEFB|nr:FadR/GntR family transcriptional regulator [Embleya scabrispora]MYS85297.1 FCD domain-containing protein [Streptomyces sp. SID5474]